MKFDVSKQNLEIGGDEVVEIEILYDELLRTDKNIKPIKPEKAPLIAYHLKHGGKWEFETKIIVEAK